MLYTMHLSAEVYFKCIMNSRIHVNTSNRTTLLHVEVMIATLRQSAYTYLDN